MKTRISWNGFGRKQSESYYVVSHFYVSQYPHYRFYRYLAEDEEGNLFWRTWGPTYGTKEKCEQMLRDAPEITPIPEEVEQNVKDVDFFLK